MRFEELTEKNIYEAINVCNASLRYDSFTPYTMRRISLRDPNFETGLAFVAYEESEPLGVVIGCRRIKQPSELINPSAGWIKLLAGIAGKEVDEFVVLNSVCEKVETELAKLGVKVIRVSDMASWHMWPGIDLRYETILEVLESRGYSKVGKAVDYLVNLRNFTIPRRIMKLKEMLSKKGISISSAKREDQESLFNWVKTKFGPNWAYEVENSFKNIEERRSGTIVARDTGTGEIIGFSTYGSLEQNWFGPIGVDEKRRNSGLGSVMLFESLRLMRLNGVTEAVIPWTSHLFFYTQVPEIIGIRHYQIMSKRLE